MSDLDEAVHVTGFTIITGLSGAGRSEAAHCLEDLGYFAVDNLSLDDWSALKNAIPNLSDSELDKLAYVLGNGNPTQASPLLIQIIGLQHDMPSVAACESLRAIVQHATEQIRVDQWVISYIKKLASSTPAPWNNSCKELLKHLTSIASA